MLELTKNITLNGVSKIDGEAVIYLNAIIDSKNGYGANINKTVVNQNLYLANKDTLRADVEAFEQAVYAVEDEAIIKTLEEK